MNSLIDFKKFKLKHLHILVIILGSVFISLSVFHTSLWFDESYSVGLANHSVGDIWTIGGNDVHPILYYYFLHFLNLIFGNNVIVYRVFSVLCTTLLGIIGFTHIRKDFGEKVGVLFSFLVFFLPANLIYAGEIRMYSLAMLLVTLTGIYAYRIYKNSDLFGREMLAHTHNNTNGNLNIKNWIIFAICSLASAYTHYYALMASGLINLILFIYLILQCVNKHKCKNISYDEKGKDTLHVDSKEILLKDSMSLEYKNMIAFTVSAIVQIILYIPWLLRLFAQMGHVSSGFWISVSFPGTFIELFNFILTGDSPYIGSAFSIVFGLIVIVYMIILYVNKNGFAMFKPTLHGSFTNKLKVSASKIVNMQPANFAIALFLGIALVASIMSFVWTPILFPRYMLCVMGFFIFFFSYIIVKKGFKHMNLFLCTVYLFICLAININLININYDENNNKPLDFVKESIKDNDIILNNNEITGFNISVNFPENTTYFYDEEYWNCGEAYKALSHDFYTVHDLDFLDDFSGRVWLTNDKLLQQLKDRFDIKVIEHEVFETSYKGDTYSLYLIEL